MECRKYYCNVWNVERIIAMFEMLNYLECWIVLMFLNERKIKIHKNPSFPVDADLCVAEALLLDGGLGLEAVRAAHDGVDDDAPEDLALGRLHRRVARTLKI